MLRAARQLHGAHLHRQGTLAGRARHLQALRDRPGSGHAVERLRALRARVLAGQRAVPVPASSGPQHWLFLSVGMANVTPVTAWNTAVSFTTNTNWQNYSGESTMSYLTQMSGLAVQNFMSAAVGLVVAIAMIRGFTRSRTDRLGNFWVDLTRARDPAAAAAVGHRRASSWWRAARSRTSPPTTRSTTLSGGHQTIVGGPVASQEVIKDMGNNGGGFFNANSAHPFENPNPFTNMFEIFLLLLIPFATPRAFGKMVGDNRQGYALVAVMVIIWAVGRRRDQLLRDRRARRDGAAARARRRRGHGGAVRHARLLIVRGVDHGDVDGRGELLPRFADAVRRRHRAVRHRARRDRARRHRGRHVRHPGAGHRHRVRGRADGRPDAGVHRQEDPARPR